MITKNKAKQLRKLIEQAAESLSDEVALTGIELFPLWDINVNYNVNDRVRYNEQLYRVLQTHTSQANWAPDVAVSLFAKVLIPDENIIPEWEQPDSTNAYQIGDKVTHNNKTWENIVANNVWEPGIYGWQEINI